MSFLLSFISSFFAGFWSILALLGLRLLTGPLVFFLFGPLFKLSSRIANFLLSKVVSELGSVGLSTDGLLAWFVSCLRLQDCVTSFVTFLTMGLMFSFIKKVFL